MRILEGISLCLPKKIILICLVEKIQKHNLFDRPIKLKLDNIFVKTRNFQSFQNQSDNLYYMLHLGERSISIWASINSLFFKYLITLKSEF